jgi:hypothetical protein
MPKAPVQNVRYRTATLYSNIEETQRRMHAPWSKKSAMLGRPTRESIRTR